MYVFSSVCIAVVPISLCNWLGSYPLILLPFTFYINVYVCIAEPQKFTESQEVWFFLVLWIWVGETQCQGSNFTSNEKKIENVMKKEAQISDIIYACFFINNEKEKKFFFYFVFRTLFICFFDSSLFVMNCND